MESDLRTINVIGGGVFGLSSALELRRRGFQVSVFDSGSIPHPLAASTDISKTIRMDYGSDELYMQLMEEALIGWRAWNRQWGRNLFHEDGVMFLSGGEMQTGGFEYESYALLRRRGHSPERVTDPALRSRFRSWNFDSYPDGYYNPEGGWAESGNVISALVLEAVRSGVRMFEGSKVERFLERDSGVTGIVTSSGEEHESDYSLVAAGTWTPRLLPELEDVMWSVGQPVVHFRLSDITNYQPPFFVPWGADISGTGWYGFPALDDGILKVANHGRGWRLDPDGPRQIPEGVEAAFREFVSATFPELAGAPIAARRLCFYCDTWDGNFWIDRHPDRPGLVVAAGGSGHGFKFAPRIGEIVADLIEEKPNPYHTRFAWRRNAGVLTEEARHT